MWHQHREIQYHDRMIQCYALTPISRHTVSHTEHGFFFLLRRRRRALVNAAFRRFGRCPPLERISIWKFTPVISRPCAMRISGLMVPCHTVGLGRAWREFVNGGLCVLICKSANYQVSAITLELRCWIQRPRFAGAWWTHGLICFLLLACIHLPATDREACPFALPELDWVSASTLSLETSEKVGCWSRRLLGVIYCSPYAVTGSFHVPSCWVCHSRIPVDTT